mmetsp:Transcript_20285/g.56341  ORF Transcript_20285/g.56341 Transcript_20285/m.56341 type:complete len:228 (-) Transcript_20285:1261-1944(-)
MLRVRFSSAAHRCAPTGREFYAPRALATPLRDVPLHRQLRPPLLASGCLRPEGAMISRSPRSRHKTASWTRGSRSRHWHARRRPSPLAHRAGNPPPTRPRRWIPSDDSTANTQTARPAWPTGPSQRLEGPYESGVLPACARTQQVLRPSWSHFAPLSCTMNCMVFRHLAPKPKTCVCRDFRGCPQNCGCATYGILRPMVRPTCKGSSVAVWPHLRLQRRRKPRPPRR